MISDIWERLSEESKKVYTPEHFEGAALRLVTEQVLYAHDKNSRVAYGIVTTYERHFRDVLDLLGVDLKVYPEKRYACALPRHRLMAASARASLEETLFALVLRKVYDTHIMSADVGENAEVQCELEEFTEAYKLGTGRESPSGVGALRVLVRTMQRWGIAREGESADESQPFVIVIRPAIVDILGETALHRLAAHAQVRSTPPTETDDPVQRAK